MNLKTYNGRSMTDALAKVKKDLGRDAVILHTRTFKRGGVLGVGAKSSVEITATIDEKVLAFRNGAPDQPAAPDQSRGADQSSARKDAVAAQPPNPPLPTQHPTDEPALRREVVEIHEMVRGLLRRGRRRV